MKTVPLLAFLIVQSLSSCTQTLKGRVVSVADGDTFTLLLNDKTIRKIRLYGVDCPEKGQDFGNVAKQYTMRRCKDVNVTVVPKGKDQYKRTIGLVLVGKDTLNVLLLKAGLAWHFNRYDWNFVWDRYEEQARKQKIGLWSVNNNTAPWKWRKRKQSHALYKMR